MRGDFLLNKLPTAQGSDTTGDANCTTARPQKYSSLLI